MGPGSAFGRASTLAPICGQAGSFSKMVTPSLMRLVISDLDASNACCKVVIPGERGGGLEKCTEGGHHGRHGEGVCDLVDEAEPGADVRDALGDWEFIYCSEVLATRFDLRHGDLKAGELHLVQREAEFARLFHCVHTHLATPWLGGTLPQWWGPEEGVINAFCFSGD